MGCSPSRGNRFIRARDPLPPGPGSGQEPAAEYPPDDDGACCEATADGEQGSWTLVSERQQATGKYSSIALSAKKAVSELGGDLLEKLAPQEIAADILSQLKQQHMNGGVDTNPEPAAAAADNKTPKRSKSKKSVKGLKGSSSSRKKEKEKKPPPAPPPVPEVKVDFPELLVKAHQAAYSYLNPSITKYEVLLGLLDNAAQTQLLLQPMVSFMLMRYEEINRGLEEIVDEGEKLLKEHGEHLAWPCPTKKSSGTKASASSSASASPTTEPPQPDLLQQLLQYTVQRMHLVSQSVSGVGDAALEEAADYFTSVTDVLEDKLAAKRASEARLMQLLSRVEAASLRRPGPEDSALFSEDSGIGGESESLLGLDRHRHRRESCESSATTRTSGSSPMGVVPTPALLRGAGLGRFKPALQRGSSLSLTSLDSFCNLAKDQVTSELLRRSMDSIDNDNDEEEDGDDEKEEGKEKDRKDDGGRDDGNNKSSPRHAAHQPRRLPSRRIENPQNIEMTLKLKDAISGRIRFLPSEKVNSNTNSPSKTKQPESPKISRRQWSEGGAEMTTPRRPQTPTPKRKSTAVRHRRAHSADSIRKAEDPTLLELERTQKDLSQRIEKMSKAEGNIRSNGPKGKGKTQPPASTSPSTPRPAGGAYGGRNNVKRLIDTFSQGVEEVQHTPENAKVLGPLKGVLKCGVPIIPGLGGAALAIGSDDGDVRRSDSRCSDRLTDVDIDSLPPPPLEVLMDNSFENVHVGGGGGEVGRGGGYSPLLRRPTVTQRLRASMQCVSVLPSRGNMRPGGGGPPSSSSTNTTTLPPCGAQQELSAAAAASAASYQESTMTEVSADSSGNSNAFGFSPKKVQRMGLNAGRKSRGLQQSPSRQRDSTSSDSVPSTPESNGGRHHQTTAAKSKSKRVRMLPTTPPVVNPSSSLVTAAQRRLPSPPVLHRKQQQPTPPSTPPATRKLPTPPPVSQRRHATSPNSATSKQRDQQPGPAAATSSTSYSFKTPSPPASPKTQRWGRDSNSSSDASSSASASSRVSSNARSVFCPASPCMFEAKPCCSVPKKPQAWASTESPPPPAPAPPTAYFWGERGRFPVSVPGRPYVRRSQSERRPSLHSASSDRTSPSVAETCGSEPTIATQQ
ncbi:photoreceptor cilium actin regulator [Engraulis encrasicolus]|uniref:photoreceptor cilium actin regulator n=1 Tax=Engraulis encrasicolus TaxID=184585 RepID=UPI002FD61F05